MFDMDGNERVDRNEFLVLERIFSTSETGEKVDLWKAQEAGDNAEKEEPSERKVELLAAAFVVVAELFFTAYAFSFSTYDLNYIQ